MQQMYVFAFGFAALGVMVSILVVSGRRRARRLDELFAAWQGFAASRGLACRPAAGLTRYFGTAGTPVTMTGVVRGVEIRIKASYLKGGAHPLTILFGTPSWMPDGSSAGFHFRRQKSGGALSDMFTIGFEPPWLQSFLQTEELSRLLVGMGQSGTLELLNCYNYRGRCESELRLDGHQAHHQLLDWAIHTTVEVCRPRPTSRPG